jgi:hypothetical protein
MTFLEVPLERGQHVTVFWPGGPYNFVLEFDWAERHNVAEEKWKDWFVIHGREVEPDPKYGGTRAFYVHPVDGGYALLPYNGAVQPRSR